MRINFKNHRVKHIFNAESLGFFCESAVIFGACKLLVKSCETETGVNTLLKNTAGGIVSLNNNYTLSALLFSGCGRGKTGGARAYNCYVTINIILLRRTSLYTVFARYHVGTGVVFTNIFGFASELASKDLDYLRSAESCLAAAESRAYAAFDCVNAFCAEGSVDSL